MTTRDETKLVLEQMLDADHSPSDLIGMLAEICDEKSEHLLSNWQDKVAAAHWQKLGKSLYRESGRLWKQNG